MWIRSILAIGVNDFFYAGEIGLSVRQFADYWWNLIFEYP